MGLLAYGANQASQQPGGISGFLKNAWQGTPAQQVGLTQGYDFLQDPAYNQAFSTLQQSPYMKQFDPSQYEQFFEQGVANPSQKFYEQNIIPSIKSNYSSPSAVHGGALSQALAQSGQELAQGLGGFRQQYLQQQQGQHAQGQLQAALQALGLSQARASQVQPIVQEAQSGWLQDLLKIAAGVAGKVGGAYLGGR